MSTVYQSALHAYFIIRKARKTAVILEYCAMEDIIVQASAQACDFELTRKEWYEIYLSAGNKLP